MSNMDFGKGSTYVFFCFCLSFYAFSEIVK